MLMRPSMHLSFNRSYVRTIKISSHRVIYSANESLNAFLVTVCYCLQFIIIIIIIINVFIHHKIKTTYLMLQNYNPNKI